MGLGYQGGVFWVFNFLSSDILKTPFILFSVRIGIIILYLIGEILSRGCGDKYFFVLMIDFVYFNDTCLNGGVKICCL